MRSGSVCRMRACVVRCSLWKKKYEDGSSPGILERLLKYSSRREIVRTQGSRDMVALEDHSFEFVLLHDVIAASSADIYHFYLFLSTGIIFPSNVCPPPPPLREPQTFSTGPRHLVLIIRRRLTASAVRVDSVLQAEPGGVLSARLPAGACLSARWTPMSRPQAKFA